jgi:hypothetical protein
MQSRESILSYSQAGEVRNLRICVGCIGAAAFDKDRLSRGHINRIESIRGPARHDIANSFEVKICYTGNIVFQILAISQYNKAR